jgi:hypothetical protein
MCCPGASGNGDAKLVLRVMVDPEAVTYTSSRPFRSTGSEAALAISMYSSEADAPPVTTSARTGPVAGGHETGVTA